MANNRIRRTKSFSSYLAAVNQDVSTLQQQNNISGIADGAIAGTNLAQEVSLSTSSMQSSNYAEGLTGWRIDGTGIAEFSDVFVRGDINAASGTIGYWNISSPGVERNIGSKRLFGTFLESSDLGDTDTNIPEADRGVYVGLFRSYRRQEVLIVSKSRRNNVAKIVAPNHGFELGDLVTVNVTGDISFSTGTGYIEVSYVDYDSFEYFNEGPDVSTSDGFQASGYANLFDENIAGLYLNDYSKSLFDYGYFSNEGVKYVSAQMYNYVHNPSFEFYQEGVRTSSASSWSVGSTLASAGSGIADLAEDAPWAMYKSTYGYEVKWGSSELSTEYLSSTVDYLSLSKMLKNNRPLFLNFDIFYQPDFDTTGPALFTDAEVLSGSPTLVTVTTAEAHGLVAGDFVYSQALNPNRTLTGTSVTTTTTATGSESSTTLTLAASVDMYSLAVGGSIVGLGIPANTTISAINIPERIVTISAATTAALADNGVVITSTLDAKYVLPEVEPGTNDLLIGSIVKVNSVVDSTTFTITNSALGGTLPIGWTWQNSGDFISSNMAKVTIPILKLSDIRFKFSNGETRPITEFLSTASVASLTSASGGAAADVYLSLTPYEIEYYISQVTPVPALGISNSNSLNTKTSRPDADIIFDISLLYALYKSVDPTGLDAGSNISLEFPGWLYKKSLGSSPNSTKITGDGGHYYIDNVFISTENRFFYADGSIADYTVSSYAWTNESVAPASSSYEKPKEWININLLDQGASLSYIDYVGFKSPLFSDNLLTKSGIYSTTTMLDGEIVYPGYQGLGNTRSTTLFLTSGAFNQKSYLTPTLNKTFESSVISRTTSENSYIQISSNNQYIDPANGYLRTYSSGLAVNSDESLSEATLYGDIVWITNKNSSLAVYDEETELRNYPDDDRWLSNSSDIDGQLEIDMYTTMHSGLRLSGYTSLVGVRDDEVIPYGAVESTYQRKLTLSGTSPIIVNQKVNPVDVVVSGTADTAILSVPDPYLILVGSAVDIPGESSVFYVDSINYTANTVTLKTIITADLVDETVQFYDENVVNVSINTAGLGGDTVAAGDGITIDSTTTPGTKIISSVVQEITSSDNTVTIDSTTTPGTYDLTVVPSSGTITAGTGILVDDTTTEGETNIAVDFSSVVGSITSDDGTVTVSGPIDGVYDLSAVVTIDATAPLDYTDGTLSILGGYAYNHTQDFYPIIYVGAATPTAPAGGFTIGDVWIDY